MKILLFLFIAALILLTANILLDFTFKKNKDTGEFSVKAEDLQFRFESSCIPVQTS